MDPLWEGIDTEEALRPRSPIAGNRLSLEYRSDGCERFLQLTEGRSEDLEQVEILHLSSTDELINQAVSSLRIFTELRVLILKGGQSRDEVGRPRRGLLTTLPPELCILTKLTYLDLSSNCLIELPSCITCLTLLSVLDLCYNQLRALPEAIGKLENLTCLSVMSNQLTEIPQSIGQLRKLDKLYLSENKLECLPQDIGCLQICTELDLSGNCLTELPETLCQLSSLQKLNLHSNKLVSISAGLASLPDLTYLNLRNNRLRYVPEEMLSCSWVFLKGNPLGEPDPSSPVKDEISISEAKEIYLEPGDNRFSVTPDGCRVYFPCGTRISFPSGAVSYTVTVYFQTLPPDQQHVKLKHHDVLLSRTLELRPHGIQFHQDVEIAIPFKSPGSLAKREIVIRTLSDQSWTDLKTRTSEQSLRQMWASCRTSHFSWFFVISRLVEDRCDVPAEGKVLFSTADQGIRVCFPPGATEETRTVRMQVLPVSAKALNKITGDTNSLTSPLLCLSQSSTTNFLNPVKIQLPLPPGVKGNSLDRSCLFLLHGDPQAQNWTDITNRVSLEISHIYAYFQVDHFSWYWLWYTTKSYVGDLAKTVYKRLRMYQVQFVAFQRKRDPEQVLLQCVPKNKVDNTVKRLHDRYRGPEPSDLVDLVEGEQFFAAFEQGLQLHSDHPKSVSGRLSFVFYSRMKNMMEVYVTSADRMAKDVKGQVSFYRGSVPEILAEQVTKHRKGPDSDWMASLPLKLPKLKSLETELGKHRKRILIASIKFRVTHLPIATLWKTSVLPTLKKLSSKLEDLNTSFPLLLNLGAFHQLDLMHRTTGPSRMFLLTKGNAEMGYLTESNLLSIARQIGREWQTIGVNLDISIAELERIVYNNSGDLDRQILEMLFLWAKRNSTQPDCVEKLVNAMKASGRTDIAEMIQEIVILGKQKYTQSIHRLGLDQGNSSEDSAIALSQ